MSPAARRTTEGAGDATVASGGDGSRAGSRGAAVSRHVATARARLIAANAASMAERGMVTRGDSGFGDLIGLDTRSGGGHEACPGPAEITDCGVGVAETDRG